MRFREIREIKEVKKVDKKQDNYKKIKPETKITTNECNDFWNNLFNNISKEEEL